MEKIVRRVAHAQRSVFRRTKRAERRQRIDEYYRAQQTIKLANREIINNIKDSKKAAKEDWELGPLAPKRDLGFNEYGVVQTAIRQDWSNYGQIASRPEIAEKRCAWAGGLKKLNLAPGDRVVILEGHDKGKIDTIKTLQPDTGSLTLENHHRVSLFQATHLTSSHANVVHRPWSRACSTNHPAHRPCPFPSTPCD